MKLVEVRALQKSFGRRKIFSALTFSVQKGERVFIGGPSGSGKTTLLRILGLLEDFDQGELKLFGQKNVKPNSGLARKLLAHKISFIHQDYGLIHDESVLYNLLIAMELTPFTRKEKGMLIEEVLEKVDLDVSLKKNLYSLSGGEKQRLSIARALLKPGELILADEPTGSLDDKNKKIVMDLLTQGEFADKTLILTSHDQELASLCTKVIDLSLFG